MFCKSIIRIFHSYLWSQYANDVSDNFAHEVIMSNPYKGSANSAPDLNVRSVTVDLDADTSQQSEHRLLNEQPWKATSTQLQQCWKILDSKYCMDEAEMMQQLLATIPQALVARAQTVDQLAVDLASEARTYHQKHIGIETFLQEYALNTQEGVYLMCLAEALLRIPDQETVNQLISETVTHGDWAQHIGHSDAWYVNASTWGLMLTGRLSQELEQASGLMQGLVKLVKKMGQPVAYRAIQQAMKIVGQQFVMATDIQHALSRAKRDHHPRYNQDETQCYTNTHSFDMLGEAALSMESAELYYQSYYDAIAALGQDVQRRKNYHPASLSIKLSALHPRYEFHQEREVFTELYPRLKSLVLFAKMKNVAVTLDAEEAHRLALSLKLFATLKAEPDLQAWSGLGLAIQAYQKRAYFVVQWLITLSRHYAQQHPGMRIPVRLVKGAYWDSEIKYAQQLGYKDYPVFTRKVNTDICYLSCANALLQHSDTLYPQFATHNAHSVASILCLLPPEPTNKSLSEKANSLGAYEFQRLHGMGVGLYKAIEKNYPSLTCRIYAPVGPYEDLLPYLVRRLLENGANTSFIHHICDNNVPIESLVSNPLAHYFSQASQLKRLAKPFAVESENKSENEGKVQSPQTIQQQNESLLAWTRQHARNPKIPVPADIYLNRVNSAGWSLDDETSVQRLLAAVDKFSKQQWEAQALIEGENPVQASEKSTSLKNAKTSQQAGLNVVVRSPANLQHVVGHVAMADIETCRLALDKASEAVIAWREENRRYRADLLDNIADQFEEHYTELIALCVFEAGKTLAAAISEVREAVDFCRYYAQCVREQRFEQEMPGPTGESNLLFLQGRGVFVCISPWNFPLAIFTGQVVAALVTGNTVLAKPAETTSLIAYRAVELMFEAGIPKDVLYLLPAEGLVFSEAVLHDQRIAGVAFTGSTQTAQHIAEVLVSRRRAITPLIAETGGMNAMIVDSSAHLEQATLDILHSAFDSSGQRCSALRVLYVQDDIVERLWHLLSGALSEWRIGHPVKLETDIGPVISSDAQQGLLLHIERAKTLAIKHMSVGMDEQLKQHGFFLAPTLLLLPFNSPEIESLLAHEQFGPILHIIPFALDDLELVVKAINARGYGLTAGIHSRLETRIKSLTAQLEVGNVYINRNMIGATVGTQPFGGCGLSGTGPKAGGPHYLSRFCVEKTVTINTAAVGGDTVLFNNA